MFIGHLRSRIVEIHKPKLPAEGGYMEMPIHVENTAIERSGAPWSFVSREIAVHLQQAILDTGIPREMWIFQPSDEAKKAFNLDFDATPMGV